jgi:hypothetical protein
LILRRNRGFVKKERGIEDKNIIDLNTISESSIMMLHVLTKWRRRRFRSVRCSDHEVNQAINFVDEHQKLRF